MFDSIHTVALPLTQRADHPVATEGLPDALLDGLVGDMARIRCGPRVDRRRRVLGIPDEPWDKIAAAQIIALAGSVLAAIGVRRPAVAPGEAEKHLGSRHRIPGAAGRDRLVIGYQAVGALHQGWVWWCAP